MELLPCPFCWSIELTEKGSFIYCHGCLCTALKIRWNTRHSPWISVKDKLPKKDGRYLVQEKHYSKWIGVMSMRNGVFESEITNWMPLPSPPESK